MAGRKGLSAFFTALRFGSKIAAGFAAVLVMLAASSLAAWLLFGQVSGAVEYYASLVNNSAIYRDIDLIVSQYRGHVREYIFSDNEDTAALALKEAGALRELIATSLTRIRDPERRRLV